MSSIKSTIVVAAVVGLLIIALDYWSYQKFRSDMQKACDERGLTQRECDAIVNILIERAEER